MYYGNYPQFQYTQPQPQRMELTKVNGIESARSYSMPPNSTMALFDANQDIMYIRSTDGAGFPTVTAYDFQLHHNDVIEPKNDYVTRKEFNQLLERIKDNGKQSVSE